MGFFKVVNFFYLFFFSECCDDTSYGTVTQDFKVSNFTGDGDPAATNADILTDADVALVRTTAKLNRYEFILNFIATYAV